MNPTKETYAELQMAYDWFNETLFDNQLPQCLIVLIKKGIAVIGYFHAEQFANSENKIADEIAMNPDYIAVRTVQDTLSTLVHEMAHLWQHHYGSPGRGRYHNKEWGRKMKEIGLHPSHTGKIGGKETGDRVSHYIIEGGLFEDHCAALLAKDFALSWHKRFPNVLRSSQPLINGQPHKTLRTTRHKFVCRGCGASAWGKPSLKILCGTCKEEMS